MAPAETISQPAVLVPLGLAPAAPAETVGVLHVINGEHYAGAERVQDLLAERLPAFGFRVGFACVKRGAFDAMRRSRETPLADLSMRSKLDLLSAVRLARLVRREEYLILHAHTVRSALVASLASQMAGVPMIYHAHSPTSRDTTRPWRNRINALVERRCLRHAARVIAVSQALADHVAAEGYDAERIAVVPNGVPAFEGVPASRPTPSGCWTLGAVALFRPRKGIEVLLDAMALLGQYGVPVRLRAVGTFESPEYRAEIESRVERLGLDEQVTWTGFTRNVGEELQRMDLLVLPSLFGEGLPMVVLEAMAAGTPVVAADVPGLSEAIGHGREGLLVEPGSAESLARAIADVVAGRYDWQSLRRRALERHARRFSDRAMAAGVARVYRHLLDQGY